MKARAVFSNALAGVLIAVINVSVAISVAALMFSAMPGKFLAAGIVVLLIGTVVIGLAGTLFSDFPAVICAPRSGLAPVFASIVGGIHATLGITDPDAVLPTVIVAIMVTSLSTGLFLLALGRFRLGKLVRYIPYPVMGGFFAGIGFIFVKGGLTVAMGQPLGMDVLTQPVLIVLGAPALVFACALYAGLNRIEHWATFPVLLLIAFAVFYGSFALGDTGLAELTAAGWLPDIGASPGLNVPVVTPTGFAEVDWRTIVQQSGGIGVVALLSAIILLLDTSGIEIIANRELNPDRELRVMGAANIASGVLGGYPGVHVASDTAFTFKLGGDSRVMGFVYAAMVVLTILAGTDFIGRIPTFVLGGLLVYVGLDFLVDWVWKTRRLLPLPDYLCVLAILGVIAAVDILEGVAFGFVVAVVLFVVNYSRLSVIKGETTGRTHGGNVDRDLQTRQLLNAEGDRILILTLQGFIFFGTSAKLMQQIRAHIEDTERAHLDFLVLDFHHVSQLDTSAIQAFSKLAQLSERHRFHVVITGADPQSLARLAQIDFLTETGSDCRRISFEQMDDGIAWCEEAILEEHSQRVTRVRREFDDLMMLVTDQDTRSAKVLGAYFTREEHEHGTYLFRQGEPGDSLYLLGSGAVAVAMEVGGVERLIRYYQAGAMIGEMALLTGDPRSASVLVETDATVYRMQADQLHALQAEHPSVAEKLNRYTFRLLSERLVRANRELQQFR